MKDMVKISNLYQTFYTKDGELEVLKNINYNLVEGEILTILGPSGSGKSTILNNLRKYNLFFVTYISFININKFIIKHIDIIVKYDIYVFSLAFIIFYKIPIKSSSIIKRINTYILIYSMNTL